MPQGLTIFRINFLTYIFWEFLKIPVRDAFNFMTEKGELQGNMKLAKICIIPKAEALLSLIKSWRPINLLTGPHKLYSGVISLRLKKVIEKVTSRCQKAYSSYNCIHENRKATVITANTLTKKFYIDSGTPQGALSSPDYFKIAVEPLLIKILSSLIINLYALQFRLKETEPKPDKTSAFADDMDTFMETKSEALVELDSILENFGELFGLKIHA